MTEQTAAESASRSASPDRVAGYHQWRQLTFLHWRTDAEQIASLLPPGLEVETFDGSAWIGLVPFSMERVRPRWFPAVPGVSWFLETNIRTYARHSSGLTGVWFFSLDANSRLAVTVARTIWDLPYFHARMSLQMRDHGNQRRGIRYASDRTGQPPGRSTVEVSWRPEEPERVAERGSLEEFLLERYVLFAPRGNGQFRSGQVKHEPYRFREARVHECSETLTGAAGFQIPAGRPADHAVISAGVDVTVCPLRPLAG